MITAIMPVRSDFENRDKLVAYIANQLRCGRVSLFLGAGVSVQFRLPNWDDLLQRMYKSQGLEVPADLNLEAAAEYLRSSQFAHNDLQFIEAVYSSLYSGVNAEFADLRQSELLEAIGAMTMSSRRGNAANVVTFNFDDLLERYLEYHGFVVESIADPQQWDSGADTVIYHPHGILPFTEKPRFRSTKLVFDQRSYSSVIGDSSGLFHQIVFTLMRRRTCLFIGLSGRDMNFDSIITRVKDIHSSKRENSAFWGIVFGTQDDAAKLRWENRGVYYYQVGTYDEIPGFLFKVCQSASRL